MDFATLPIDERNGQRLWAVDLRQAPSLAEQLAHLDYVRDTALQDYPEAWHAALYATGGYASVNYQRDGEQQLSVGYATDAQESERRVRKNAFVAHLYAINGARDGIVSYLERRGHVSDNRPVSPVELKRAVRAFLGHGGTIMLNPKMEIDNAFPLERVLDLDADPKWCDGAIQGYRDFVKLSRRWRARALLTRIIQSLGFRLANGWVVLEPDRAPPPDEVMA